MASYREAPVTGVSEAEGSSEGQVGTAAAAGIGAAGMGKGRGSGPETSVSAMSRNLNKGGWSGGKEEVNHMVLYI